MMNVLLALDEVGNSLLGGAPGETLSSRAGRGALFGTRVSGWLCRVLDWLEPGHCRQAVDAEIRGIHQSQAIRDLRAKKDRGQDGRGDS